MSQLSLSNRIKRVKMVVFDVDGVLTDGTIFISADGREMKAFNVLDGTGVKYLERGGIATAILSGRSARATAHRARELGIKHVLQNYKVKVDGLNRLLKKTGRVAEEICYIGDDLPDLPVMRMAGLAVAVANARPEVISLAHWTTQTPGGRGAAREVAEQILKVQGKWREIVSRYGLSSETANARQRTK